MDEEYNVIVLRTGLKECILNGLLSVNGLKIRFCTWIGKVTMVENPPNLISIRGSDIPLEQLGSSRNFNVNVIPKFKMANGGLVRVLIHTNVTRDLNFKAVDGSFVYSKGKIHKVPANDVEALKSPLMRLFEKRRVQKIFIYVEDYDENNPNLMTDLTSTKSQ